jgi:hypothetical protein
MNNKREQERRYRELEQQEWENFGPCWSILEHIWRWKNEDPGCQA